MKVRSLSLVSGSLIVCLLLFNDYGPLPARATAMSNAKQLTEVSEPRIKFDCILYERWTDPWTDPWTDRWTNR